MPIAVTPKSLSRVSVGATFHHPPGAQSSVVIQTRPMASCPVRPSEGDRQKSVARFFADQRGIAQFFVKPEASGQATARFAVHCATTGTAIDYDVELRVAGEPNADYPPPPMPPPIGRTRPALSEQEAARASDQELIKRGYPLPPDPQLSPEGYKLWLQDVTHPSIIVNPGLISNPYTRHDYGRTRSGLATSSNWSGVELRGGGGPFAWVSSWRSSLYSAATSRGKTTTPPLRMR